MEKYETAIAVFPDHDDAERAVKSLTASGFDMRMRRPKNAKAAPRLMSPPLRTFVPKVPIQAAKDASTSFRKRPRAPRSAPTSAMDLSRSERPSRSRKRSR
jgi:hypothetical protein